MSKPSNKMLSPLIEKGLGGGRPEIRLFPGKVGSCTDTYANGGGCRGTGTQPQRAPLRSTFAFRQCLPNFAFN